MSAILSIGTTHYFIGSAAIASAVREVLSKAVRLEPVVEQNQLSTWRASTEPSPQVALQVAPDPGTIGIDISTLSPFAQAILGEPPKSRQRTHSILTAESRRLTLERRVA